MKKIFCSLTLIFLLSSCNKNISSSIYNSSSFRGYPDISSTIVDSGSSSTKKTFVVEGKIETSSGDKVLPFNTQMTLTSFSNNSYDLLSPIYDYHIKRLHVLFDRYNKYKDENGEFVNNLKVVNDSYASGKEIVIDEDLFNLLEMSIELSKLTKGYFNPTMGALIDGWNNYFSPFGLTNNDFTIDDEVSIISRTKSIVNYEDLDKVIELNKERSSVKFNRYNDAGTSTVIISLGAIAKGYAIDYMRKKYERHDVPLLISGSASSSYLKGINPNPKRDNWNVQINSPFKDELSLNKPLLISELPPERVISTSGDYEQLFYYYDNEKLVRRHHILNPFTGHSEDFYRGVTLYAESRSDILDGLSTALFNIDDFGLIKTILSEVETYYNINIDCLFQKEVDTNTVDLFLNEGFENTINTYYDVNVRKIERIDV